MMRIGIIAPYFGKLPKWFQLFLDSCRDNPKFDWIILSDDTEPFDYPENVHFFKMSFAECQKVVQAPFDFKVEIPRPHKLCDYRAAYGLIFEEYLKEYDWWGHCDLDIIWGKLENFITEEMLLRYDKIYSGGHLALYRNMAENNRVFMSEVDGKRRYREVFSTGSGCVFDEWGSGSINEIYLAEGRPIRLENDCADLDAYSTAFVRMYFDTKTMKYRRDNIENSIFKWEEGRIYQIYQIGQKVSRKEFAYIHLFKKQMVDERQNKNGPFYMVPNRFVDGALNEEMLLKQCRKWELLNVEYFKVKWKSFKYRWESGNWSNISVIAKLKEKLSRKT
ncbi:MAG: hypothetical protein Q4C72_03190 [Eubacteriales bacterium]|nr:hypothetical protein [Eubacteriales bacterium]